MKERLGACCGTWDCNPLHAGHTNFLQEAKDQADELVVFVNTDVVVERNKGEPPLHAQEERISFVELASIATKVVPFRGTDEEQIEQIALLKPDVYFLSEDGNPHFDEPLQQRLKPTGTIFVTIPRLPDISTSQIRARRNAS